MAKAKAEYGNESISQLKGADRVRKRPGVIFGSDGLDGCEHSVFEIISNSIDEAREGHGKKIVVTRFLDNSVEVQLLKNETEFSMDEAIRDILINLDEEPDVDVHLPLELKE